MIVRRYRGGNLIMSKLISIFPEFFSSLFSYSKVDIRNSFTSEINENTQKILSFAFVLTLVAVGLVLKKQEAPYQLFVSSFTICLGMCTVTEVRNIDRAFINSLTYKKFTYKTLKSRYKRKMENKCLSFCKILFISLFAFSSINIDYLGMIENKRFYSPLIIMFLYNISLLSILFFMSTQRSSLFRLKKFKFTGEILSKYYHIEGIEKSVIAYLVAESKDSYFIKPEGHLMQEVKRSEVLKINIGRN